MEELFELVAAIALAVLAFAVMATWYGLKFLGYSVLAAFSKEYRQRLMNEWQKSRWNKALMIGGAAFYLAALGFAGQFWWSVSRPGQPPVKNEFGWNDMPFTEAEKAELLTTRKISEFVDKTRKLKQRMLEDGRLPPGSDSASGPNPAPGQQERDG
ncbi:MAG TPA: hypothetical protein VGE29_06090 [Prosthecobacter sp.]